jgi:uncharacterized protein DUF6878
VTYFSSRWSVTPRDGSDGPFHAVAPDGTEHGNYKTWKEAYEHSNREQSALETRELNEMASALTPLLRRLKERGATAVRASYSGSGDEGNFEPVGADNATLTAQESEELEGFFEHTLYQRHGGWENHEGGFGEFEIDLTGEEFAVTHTHNDYVEDYETTEHPDLPVCEPPSGEPELASVGG